MWLAYQVFIRPRALTHTAEAAAALAATAALESSWSNVPKKGAVCPYIVPGMHQVSLLRLPHHTTCTRVYQYHLFLLVSPLSARKSGIWLAKAKASILVCIYLSLPEWKLSTRVYRLVYLDFRH